MPKPRLLFLSQLLPFPPDSGAAIRTFNVLRILSSEFDVTALCFSRTTESQSAGSRRDRAEALAAFGTVEAFPIPGESSRRRLLWDHLRSVMTRRPYVRYVYASEPFQERLDAELRSSDFDLAHIDSLDLAGYLNRLVGLPRICVHHNVESVLLRRRAEAAGSTPARSYLRLQARLLEEDERRWCPELALNVVVSEDDCRILRAIAPTARFEVFPNGVDVEHYHPAEGRDEGLCFVGGATWFPNRDALVWFSDEVLPVLHRGGHRPTVTWVGKASGEDQREFGKVPGLDLTGYVEDERPIMRDAACFIVPLRVGGGTRLKILNAWAMGKAVVSTSVGCEGLDARDGENIMIADTAEAFAGAIACVLEDASMRARLGTAARATARASYSWEVIGARMLSTYGSLLR